MNPGDKVAEQKFKEASGSICCLKRMQKNVKNTISLVMQPLNRAVAEPADLADLILTELIWEIFSEIFFGDIFGGGRSRRNSNGPMRGADLRAAVRISLKRQ